MDRSAHYWFPAKRYGWGWGLPSRWQGWAVYAGYVAALVALWRLLPPRDEPVLHAAIVVVLSLVLVGVCWLKGEPPRWRWGR